MSSAAIRHHETRQRHGDHTVLQRSAVDAIANGTQHPQTYTRYSPGRDHHHRRPQPQRGPEGTVGAVREAAAEGPTRADEATRRTHPGASHRSASRPEQSDHVPGRAQREQRAMAGAAAGGDT